MIHPTAAVSPLATIGQNVQIWHQAQIRENTIIGDDCIIGKNVYIDHSVKVGSKVKIQNNCSLYSAIIEDGVFIGPHVCFTNDKIPRAIDVKGNLKSGGSNAQDWEILTTTVKKGASIGAASVLLPGITIGKYAMIGAGSVVTKDVPDFCLILGNPARVVGYVCKCGRRLEEGKKAGESCKLCQNR